MPIDTGRHLLAVSIACIAALSSAEAANVVGTRVTHDNGRYVVNFDVRIEADEASVRRQLTDYTHYTRLSDSITESRIVRTYSTTRVRVAVRLDSCILIFCKTVNIVREVETLKNGDIVTEADPAESDFSEARERWRISGDKGATRLIYDAELVPSFYVPPLIGPWLLKSRIRRELRTTAERLELLAHP